MPLFSRLIKNRTIRKGAAESLDFSANVPASGPTSVQNSQGTSKTSVDVIAYLHNALDEFDPDETVGNNFNSLKIRLGERISRYSNVGFAPIDGQQWISSSEVRKLMQIAVECSVDVYGPSFSELRMKDLVFSRVQHFSASLDAVTKETKIFEVHSNPRAQQGVLDPLLVVAVRGTVQWSLDWTVNLKIETRDAGEFLDLTGNPTPTDQQANSTTTIHAGFLAGAKKLLPIVLQQLEDYRSSPYKHVLLTGHSAGGAISSLVFMNILNRAKAKYPGFRFSLITFGAPPTTSRSLTAQMKRLSEGLPHPGIALAVINEHDPITRIDSGYVKSIIDLYDAGTGSLMGNTEPSGEAWALPSPDLYPMGDLIVIKDMSLEDDSGDNDVYAYETTPATLSQRIFCDPRMHGKAVYLQRINRLAGQDVHVSSG